MKSEERIRKKLRQIEPDEKSGHDQSHTIGFRNALLWVLED